MEQIVTWKSPKKIAFFLLSLLLLGGLLIAANIVNPVIHFADPNLEKAIRKKIHQPNAPISRLDVLAITTLDASNMGIQRLDGIEALHRLAKLDLTGNAVQDLRPLAALGMLAELDLTGNHITDLDSLHLNALARLPLRSLNLQTNSLQNVSALANFHTLSKLNLRGNQIEDVEPLTGLTGLIYLNIHTNPIKRGLPTLARLQNLETLILRNVQVGENFAFLASLKKLQNLNLRNTGITDLSVIAKLMQDGALQDHVETGSFASINLLQVNPSANAGDPYALLRPYWDNIAAPFPSSLPYAPRAMPAPSFSQPSGFYTDAFSLTLSAEPGTSIYYTLDGAAPALNPQLEPIGSTQSYTGPILIQNRAQAPNVLANIVTEKWKEYVPSGPVFKGNVVRAISVDAAGKRSNVETRSYFVDVKMSERYSLPVVSLVTSPRNLFDDEVGIYTFGNAYKNIYPDEPWRNPANYTQRGQKWDRPASFELFSPQGQTLIAQNIAIRIHGGFSRAFSPKGLRLVTGAQYDAQDSFQYDFFPALNGHLREGSVTSYQTLILRSGGNDVRTMLKDAIAQSLLAPTRMDMRGAQPVVVFIDGEYWGIQNIRTRFDANYFQQYYGIAPNQLLMIERNDDTVFYGDLSKSSNTFANLYSILDPKYLRNDYATSHAAAEDAVYRQISARVDIDNFILHFLSQIYFDNTDWPKTNSLAWEKLGASDSAAYGHDGKLRWMTTDVDLSFNNPEHNNLKRILNDLRTEPSTYLMRCLLENQEFRVKFINQFADQLNSTFREPVVLAKIDEFEHIYAPEMAEHIQRWGLPAKSPDAWLESIEQMRKFARQRPALQRQQIMAQFKLPGIANITLHANPAQGHIRINTLEIKNNIPGVVNPAAWTGVYFQGIPVEITALPLPGYRFAGWGETDAKESTLTLTLTQNITLTAKFEKEK